MPLKSFPNLGLSHTHFLIDQIREIANWPLHCGPKRLKKIYRQVIVLSKAEGKMI